MVFSELFQGELRLCSKESRGDSRAPVFAIRIDILKDFLKRHLGENLMEEMGLELIWRRDIGWFLLVGGGYLGWCGHRYMGMNSWSGHRGQWTTSLSICCTYFMHLCWEFMRKKPGDLGHVIRVSNIRTKIKDYPEDTNTISCSEHLLWSPALFSTFNTSHLI